MRRTDVFVAQHRLSVAHLSNGRRDPRRCAHARQTHRSRLCSSARRGGAPLAAPEFTRQADQGSRVPLFQPGKSSAGHALRLPRRARLWDRRQTGWAYSAQPAGLLYPPAHHRQLLLGHPLRRLYPAATGTTAPGNNMLQRTRNMTQERYRAAIAAFDKANAEDTNKEEAGGKEYPKELLYAQRMSAMLERYAPEASEAVKLAVRAQHIQRWKIPRNSYPLGRPGYLQWRTGLYKFHAETAGRIMQEAGYDNAMVERVKAIVSKQGL